MFNLQLYWKRDSWHRCFPVNFAKFLIIPLSQNTSKRLILQLLNLFFSTQNIIKKLVRKNLIIFCLLIVPEKTGWYFPHPVWMNTEMYRAISVFNPNARKCPPEKTPYSDTLHAMIFTSFHRSISDFYFEKNIVQKVDVQLMT